MEDKKPVLFAAIRKDQDEKISLIRLLDKKSKAEITRDALDYWFEYVGDKIIKDKISTIKLKKK